MKRRYLRKKRWILILKQPQDSLIWKELIDRKIRFRYIKQDDDDSWTWARSKISFSVAYEGAFSTARYGRIHGPHKFSLCG